MQTGHNSIRKLEDCNAILKNDKMKCISYANHTLCSEGTLPTKDGMIIQKATELHATLPGKKQLCYGMTQGNDRVYGIARKNKNFAGAFNQHTVDQANNRQDNLLYHIGFGPNEQASYQLRTFQDKNVNYV